MQSGDTSSRFLPRLPAMTGLSIAGQDESGQKLGKIEAIRHKVRTMAGRAGRASRRRTGEQETAVVIARFTGALLRAFLVVLLVATPSLILPSVSGDARQAVSLVALFVAAFVLVEYASTYPGLVEFRHAPPFNRLRFASLLCTVAVVSLLVRGAQGDTAATTLAVTQVGAAVGSAIDFPYSPVRLVLTLLPPDASAEERFVLRAAAGLAYLISLVTLGIFVVLTRANRWPRPGTAFNVWINLPTFDPTAGGDVVTRLERDARVNIALGFLLPFLAPAVFRLASTGFIPVSLDNPQMLIWTMAAWSFLPASLFMRGIAMGRVAQMIRALRARAEARALTGEGRLAPA
jgi:hypothetical protein